MDFQPSAEQLALQDAVRALCAGRFPMSRLRAIEESHQVDRDGWRAMADTGIFSLRLPENEGGVGLGMADAVLVFEELGRALVTGPVLASHLVAGVLPGSTAAAAGVAGGDRVVGLIDRRDRVLLVEYLESLDSLVIVDDFGLWMVDPSSLDAKAVERPLDPMTPLHQVSVLPQGVQVASSEMGLRLSLEGTVLSAALLLGIAAATTDMATEYAKQRVQFDKPIGAFQAVKHLVADMFVRSEVARAAVYAAGVTLDDPVVGSPARAASSAKVTAGSAALANCKSCIQVHGGMGFTWEVDVHRYLKRAWLLDTVFGSVEDHAGAMADLI
jgi:alkylation response protein AidB-like acyl-CoA dehydrogenase